MYNQIKHTRQMIHNINSIDTKQLKSNITEVLFNKFSFITDDDIIKSMET